MTNKLIIIALAISSSAYSKSPELPKPQEGKYAVQIIKVLTSKSTVPRPNKRIFVQDNDPLELNKLNLGGIALPDTPNAKEILNDPDSEISVLPILYTEVGSSVTNDQTEISMFPEDWEIRDGKAIPKEKPVKLGTSISSTITACENNIADVELDFYFKKFKGYDEYEAGEGIKVEMPYFESRDLNMNVSIPLGEGWTVLGGFENKTEEKKPTTLYYLVRVI